MFFKKYCYIGVGNYGTETTSQQNQSTELPLDFDDSIDRAVSATLRGIQQGKYRIRIDFDTSIGDQVINDHQLTGTHSVNYLLNFITKPSAFFNRLTPQSRIRCPLSKKW